MNRGIRGRRALIAALALCSFAAVPHSSGSGFRRQGTAAPEITAISTRAEYVSGGDVLVEVRTHDRRRRQAPAHRARRARRLAAFREMPDGSRLGLLTGLSVGPHTIVARTNGRGQGARRAAPRAWRSSTTRSPARCSRVRSSSRSSARRAGRARPADRRRLLGADADQLPLPHDGRRVRHARRPDRAARRRCPDHDHRRSHRRLHRPPRAGHDRPGGLRDRRPPRPDPGRRARSRPSRGGTSASSTRSAAAATSATTRERARAACSTTCSCPAATPSPRRASTSTRPTAAR